MITAYLPIRNSLLLCRWSAFHSFKQTGPMMQHRRFVLTLQQLPSDIDIYSTTHCSLQIDLALLDNEMGWQRKPQTCLTYILYYFIDCYNTPQPLVLVKMLRLWTCKWSEFSYYNSWIYLQSILPCTSDKKLSQTSSFIGLITKAL